jgi:ligand-binding sensor domain-containing protein/signal transduction histidine kinase
MSAFKTNRGTALLRSALLLCMFLWLGMDVQAERLPIKSYDAADGLASSFINHVDLDSHGFVWISTRNGLSRFDGYHFVTYNTEQGLSASNINDLLESHDGTYWIATNGGGVCLFNPEAGPMPIAPVARGASGTDDGKGQLGRMFTVYPVGESAPTSRVNVLYEDRAHQIWAGTDGGLFRLRDEQGAKVFRRVELSPSAAFPDAIGVTVISGDAQGSIWIGTDTAGLFRLWPDGHSEQYTTRNGLPNNQVLSLLNDQSGALWAGTLDGLCQFGLDGTQRQTSVTHIFTIKDGLGDNFVRALYQSSDKRIWISTGAGLTEFDGQRFQNYTMTQGLSDNRVTIMTEDRQGDLWIGTANSGVMRLTRNGFISYGTADGVGLTSIHSLWENQDGKLLAVGGDYSIARFDGKGITSIRPELPELATYSWGSQAIFLDHEGCFWALTSTGLYRYPKVAGLSQLARAPPRKVYTSRDGLAGDDAYRMFEDSRGDIWISTESTTRDRLTRWDRATETFHVYSEADGLPSFNAAFSFCEDHLGNLWIGFVEGGLARYANGRFTFLTSADGLPAGLISALYLDREKRLWIGGNQGGLARIDDTTEARPHFLRYTSAQGLITNDVRCITEDLLGRLYIGTSRGIDRLDPVTGHIKHYTKADGLSNEFVTVALRDRLGALWFGTQNGLSRLVPQEDQPEPPPTVLISGLRIAGVQYPLSELGETIVSGLRLDANQNQIQIDFGGLAFDLSDVLRFQYKLEGVDRDWSAPTDQRTVNYISLAPGTYRFLLRAINDDGVVSQSPAVVAFTILPPIWRTWWFLTLTAFLLAGVAYLLYRYRVAQLIHVERVRTRIASDLHDDIGSSLSQIAVLSEVLRTQATQKEREFARPLAQIARVSREAVDSMSDIVWAINPQRDHLHDLTRRMRRFASEIFPASGIEFSLKVPGPEQDIRLGADIRRQVFLIFKEGVNNIVRHSECSVANMELNIAEHWLILYLKDDGKGFDPNGVNEGNGLMSLRRRAKSMGGELEMFSEPGRGATLTLKIPLRHRG